MEINPIAAATQPRSHAGARSNELGADDFLQLLVTQLTNQDPLEPTNSQELLGQLSAIRDIQSSTTLTKTLETLTGNQRYGSAAALIGKEVSGKLGDESTGLETVSGVVRGIRFDSDGKVQLELDSGAQLPLERLESVADAGSSASTLIGQLVRGVDSRSQSPDVIEGVVTAVRRDAGGDIVLELDTGQTLRSGDLVQAA